MSAETLLNTWIDKLSGAERKLMNSIALVERHLEGERSRIKSKEPISDRHPEVRKSVLLDLKHSLSKRLGAVTSHRRILARTKAISTGVTLIHAVRALQDRVNNLDLSAGITAVCKNRWQNCTDAVTQIERELFLMEISKTATAHDLGGKECQGPLESREISSGAHSTRDLSSPVYMAMYNYRPTRKDELQLRKGDYYTVTEKCQDGWYKGQHWRTGNSGIFPGNYVRLVK